MTEDPAFADEPTVEITDVSVWFGPKVALSELSCSFGAGRDRAARAERRRQDDVDAVRSPGMLGVNQGPVRIEGEDPRRDRAVHRRVALVPEDEAVPRGADARGSSCATSPTFIGSDDRGAPDAALASVGLLDVADRRRRRVQQGHAPAHEGRRRPRQRTRRCSCSTSR